MGTTDSATYAVEYQWEDGEWVQVADGFNSKSTANTYIIGRARENDSDISRYRIVTCVVVAKPTPVKGDMKEGLTNGKPQLSQIPHAAQVYASRSFEYGSHKYERGNYLRPTVDRLADFDRLASYLDAALRHITKTTTEMNRARGCTDKTDADLMAGAMCLDVESGLPHLCGAMCSIMMGIQQAVDAGLLPADPGQPWLKKPNLSS